MEKIWALHILGTTMMEAHEGVRYGDIQIDIIGFVLLILYPLCDM